mmetsp:Transcript_16195/g.21454  ORF Transcript_16195/g.21454 Transcript_16195/m.21454 type:complete len:315 (-) Transcript_16195:132-1076(-)
MCCEEAEGFIYVGNQDGEAVLLFLRGLTMLICISCLQYWTIPGMIQKRPLFFIDWAANAGWIICQYSYSMFIQTCAYSQSTKWIIFSFKFVENFLSQSIAFSTLVIHWTLFEIVRNNEGLSKLKFPSSKTIIKWFGLGSLLVSITSAIFWDQWFVTDTYLWVASTTDADLWTNVSFSLGPAACAVMQVPMFIHGMQNLDKLKASVSQQPILWYFVWLIFFGFLSNTVSLVHFISAFVSTSQTKSVFFTSNIFRSFHIAADTIVIMRSAAVTRKKRGTQSLKVHQRNSASSRQQKDPSEAKQTRTVHCISTENRS